MTLGEHSVSGGVVGAISIMRVGNVSPVDPSNTLSLLITYIIGTGKHRLGSITGLLLPTNYDLKPNTEYLDSVRTGGRWISWSMETYVSVL